MFAELITQLWTSNNSTNLIFQIGFFCKKWSQLELPGRSKKDFGDDSYMQQMVLLWDYIKNYLNNELQMISLRNYSNLDFVYDKSLLSLSKNLLSSGLINSQKNLPEFKDIIVNMINELFNDPSNFTDVEDHGTYPCYNECKLMLTHLYKMIMDFEAEIFVNEILVEVKELHNKEMKKRVNEPAYGVDDEVSQDSRPLRSGRKNAEKSKKLTDIGKAIF